MNILIPFLDYSALIVQLVGTAIMFYNSPDNKPEGVVMLRNFGEADFEKPKHKNHRLKRGFFILGIGFLLAFISLILKSLVPTCT